MQMRQFSTQPLYLGDVVVLKSARLTIFKNFIFYFVGHVCKLLL